MKRYHLNVLMFFIVKINEYRSMLWSLWIIYILFDKKFKTKINTNIFRFKTFTFYMLYLSWKLCLHPVFKLLERARIQTLPRAPLCIDMPLVPSKTRNCFYYLEKTLTSKFAKHLCCDFRPILASMATTIQLSEFY